MHRAARLFRRDKAASADDELPPVKRPWGWILGGVAGAGLALAAGVWWAWPALNARVETRNLEKARALAGEEQYREAQLLLEQAVQANPGSFEARRHLAAFYQAARSPQALGMWEALAAAEPGKDVNQLGVAGAAVQMRRPAVAKAALAQVSAAGQASEEFLRLAAAVAVMESDRERLGGYLARLHELNPGDAQTSYNLAVTQLASADPAEVARGRAGLIALARGDELRIRAILALFAAPGAKGDAQSTELIAKEILGADVGARVGPLHAMPGPGAALRAHLQAQPKVSAADAVAWSEWLRARGDVAEAEAWLGGLAGTLGREQVFLAEAARCALLLRRWTEFKGYLRGGAWGPALPDDTLDLAFAARVQQARGKSGNALATWDDAIAGARGEAAQLRWLARLASAFEWSVGYERTLLELVRVDPKDTEAWRALLVTTEAEGAAGPVVAVLGRWAQAPNVEPAIRGEWLLTAALNELMDAKWQARAEQLVAESAATPDRTAASVEALGVWLAWRRPEPALEAVEQAARLAERAQAPGESAKFSPRARLALAVVLAEGGRKAEAAELLKTVSGFRFLRAEEARRDAIASGRG